MKWNAREWSLAALSIASIAASMSMLDMRTQRDWAVQPRLPYSDPVSEHWLYRVLGASSQPGQSLGVWGWAAHMWVYSGLIPATRESSTEFAWRNWGPAGYYRKRYLEALHDRPPEFFVEAVGPNQFLFVDRAKYGVGSLPGLRDFLGSGYDLFLDDGDTGLWMRRDYLRQCCIRPPASAWKGSGKPVLLWADGGHAAIAKQQGWRISDGATSGGVDRLRLSFAGTTGTAVLPFMLGPASDRSKLRIEHSGSGASDCDRRVSAAAPLTIELCSIQVNRGESITVVDDNPSSGSWIALGSPLLIRQDRGQGK